MIFQNNDRQLEKSGEFKSQTFGIKNAGKIFKILVDGIYSDPYGSIVREIASNAIDANTESESNKNTLIKWIDKNIITGSEETLLFRDYGKGMSPEIMFDVFCNLGESTKENSNLLIGGFGIGAKSPFKYTDSFTVRTIFEDNEYLYNLNLNQEGIAEANLIYSQETEEESGTEVQIPIKYGDKSKFINAIQKQLFYFPIDYENINVFTPHITEDQENFIVTTNCPIRELNIKLGNVLYPINNSLLNIPYNLFNKSITLKFNIGEIFPIASRESIDYTEDTKKKILNKLELVRKQFTEVSIEKINTEKNIFKWYILINKFSLNTFLLTKDQEFKFENRLTSNFSNLKEYFHVETINKVKGRKYNSPYKIVTSSTYITELELPIFYKFNNYSTEKSMYLYDKIGKFIVIQERVYGSYEEFKENINEKSTKLSENIFIKRQQWLLNNIKNNCDITDYDSYVIPEEETIKIEKVKKVKKVDEISIKKFYHEGYGRDGYKFNNNTFYILNNTNTIIYSYINEGEDFVDLISLFSRYRIPDRIANYIFIKIGKSSEHLINGIHFSKLIKQEMTTDILRDILTVNFITQQIEYKYLNGLILLKKLDLDIYSKYIKLINYISDYENNNSYINKELFKATIDLAVENNLLNNNYLDLYNELVEFNQNIKVLSYINREIPSDILEDLLQLKGIQIQNKIEENV